MTATAIFYETPQSWLHHSLFRIRENESSITIDAIAVIVAEYTSIPLEKLRSSEKRRKREIVEIRQIAMWLSRQLTAHSFKSIGSYFGGKDHSTVVHACKTVEDLMVTDRDYKLRLLRIQNLIK